MASHSVPWATLGPLLHGGDVRAPAAVFESIFEVFLALGTLVGVVVVAYTLYHAVKYRATGDSDPFADSVERPRLGELPAGGAGGRKVFLSLGISAVIVLSLIGWTYVELSYVEDGPDIEGEEDLRITVEGYQFGWDYAYFEDEVDNDSQVLTSGDYNATELNANADSNALVVPKGTTIQLDVTSRDVWHNYGIPEFRAKTDAIPDQTTNTWFEADEPGLYEAKCYELCGQGHSNMKGDVLVLEEDRFVDWYTAQNGTDASHIDFMEGSGS
mgnify:CR=1 FL=1